MKYPKVTLTMTTGCRYHLFTDTINSFFGCCKDIDLIERIVIGDDGSIDKEITDMVNYIKQHTNVSVTVLQNQEHGQANNLNNLWGNVNTDFVFHTEDDWHYTRPGHFIRECFDVANCDSRCKNVILRGWKSCYVKDGAVEYYAHVYQPQDEYEHTARSDCDWYGLSFNPGILHLPTIRKYMPFSLYRGDDSNRAWDKVVAKSYMEDGCVRANLYHQYIKHIGVGNSRFQRTI